MGKTSWFRVVAKEKRETDNYKRSSGSGRFHSPMSGPTSYAAVELTTAWKEVTSRVGVPVATGRFCAVTVTVETDRIADFTDAATRARLGITEAELLEVPAPSICCRVADQLRAEGFAGIKYRSVQDQPDGICIVIFLDTIRDEEISWSDVTEEQWARFATSIGN